MQKNLLEFLQGGPKYSIMTSNECYYNLNISTDNALRSDWQYPRPRGAWGMWKYPVSEIFSDQWVAYVRESGLEIVDVLLFYKGYNGTQSIAHVDYERHGRVVNYSLNWCVGGRNSFMIWYRLPEQNQEIVETTGCYTACKQFPVETLEEIARKNIGTNLVLTRTNLPHAIHLEGDPRWCFSCRTPSPWVKTWEEMMQFCLDKGLIQSQE